MTRLERRRLFAYRLGTLLVLLAQYKLRKYMLVFCRFILRRQIHVAFDLSDNADHMYRRLRKRCAEFLYIRAFLFVFGIFRLILSGVFHSGPFIA